MHRARSAAVNVPHRTRGSAKGGCPMCSMPSDSRMVQRRRWRCAGCYPAMVSLLVSAQLISPLAPAALADPTGPAVSLSRTSMNFGNQGVGTTSAPQTIVLQNTGSSDLVISSITFAPPYGADDFGEADTCTTRPLAPGAQCTITVTFEPTFPGVRTGQLAIT